MNKVNYQVADDIEDEDSLSETLTEEMDIDENGSPIDSHHEAE